jgi:geranylgeranyl pyrophosphate synthase
MKTAQDLWQRVDTDTGIGMDRGAAREAVVRELDGLLAGDSGGLAVLHQHALLPAGKLLRPLLVVKSAVAVGGSPSAVLPAAVGLELLHVGSLIHDDIIDGDIERRGRAAVHHRFGTDRAIIGGDALFFRPFVLLAECRERGVPDDRIVRACRALAVAGEQLCQGAALELDLVASPHVPVSEYLRMAGLKTSPLLAGACRIGAILSGADETRLEALGRYGHALGIAFQARDDLLPYDTAPEAAGKPTDSDLGNHRPTLPVLLAYQRAGVRDRDLIEKLLADGGRGSDSHTRMAEVLRRTEAAEGVRTVVADYVQHCLRALEHLRPGPAVTELALLAERLLREPADRSVRPAR